MKRIIVIILIVTGIQKSVAQSDKVLVTNTLMDYIEGTSNGEPDRIKRAFHKDLHLYSIANDSLRSLSGQKYIGYFKKGQKHDRIGKIVSIDIVNDAAMAKVEIDFPSKKRLYTDFMMLLKVNGKWKIIHKSYTFIKY
ncbi:nuclear transport factor 2 family protein [Aquimarina sp. AU474]|uniref:nuclear transport factor 2 family protein n=1 Tax=Aquimarina sp. AU474 TaxID=2108529 RepID=UPI000D69993D|nr:nuclear transport factor 2 family protein [Aquimarina sp. AU474]